MGHRRRPVRHALLKEIAELIGNEAMRTLWKAVSGTRTYIPARVRPTHWLVKLIGLEAAGKLCRYYTVRTVPTKTGKMGSGSGASLEFPVFPRDDSPLVTEMSSRNAALALGISQRAVHRRRAKLREGGDAK